MLANSEMRIEENKHVRKKKLNKGQQKHFDHLLDCLFFLSQLAGVDGLDDELILGRYVAGGLLPVVVAVSSKVAEDHLRHVDALLLRSSPPSSIGTPRPLQ